MAAYEKQQPQPSSPPLNAAYYGPAIPPPQPAYYGAPPAAPRRSGTMSCLFGCLFKFIAPIVILFGAAILVLWLVFRPYNLKAYADSATLSRFDLGTGGGDRDLLQYNLTVNIRLRNPNRFGVRYDYAEAQAFYDGERFGYAPLQPFRLESKSDETIAIAFNGSTVMDDDDDVRRTYQEEKRDGFYYVRVRVYSDLSYKIRAFRLRNRNSKITCVLRLPVPAGGNAGPAPVTSLGTRCDVHF